MSKRQAEEENDTSEKDKTVKKRAPNFKHDEIIFLLREIQKSKTALFGKLSPTLTFHMKTKAWLAVRDHLVGAGYPHRSKEQLKKKWEDNATSTKAKYARKRKTGGSSIEWTNVDKLVTDILGKDNPSLTAIPGGIDCGDIRSVTRAISIDNSSGNSSSQHRSTSSSPVASSHDPTPSNKGITHPSTDMAVTDHSESEEDYGYVAEDNVDNQKCQPQESHSISSNNWKVSVDEVYEKHLTEQHDIKMRIYRKKEELIDLKLKYCRQKISNVCDK